MGNKDIDQAIKNTFPPTSVEEYLQDMVNVILLVEQEIEKVKSGDTEGSPTLKQLEYALNELREFQVLLQTGNLEEIKKKRLVSAHMVTDSWPNGNQLGDEICRLNLSIRMIQQD